MENGFDEKFYMATLRTADAVGMSIIPLWKAARLMAIIYVWGGGDEGFTHCPKLKCDIDYLQEKYQLYGTGIPPAEFAIALQKEVRDLEEYARNHTNEQGQCPQYAKDFMKDNYGFTMKGV